MRIVTFILFVLSVTALSAQKKKDKVESSYITQPNRIEFEIGDRDIDYHTISGGEDGLLLVIETDERSEDGYHWVFHYMDTLLNVQWTRLYVVPFESSYTGYDYFQGKFYLLFNSSKYKNEELQVYELDIASAEIRELEISTVFPVQLTEFEVLGNSILLGGYANFRPVLIIFDMDQQKPKVVPGFYENNSDLLDLITDDEAEVFTVIQSERMVNRRYTVMAKTFTSEGILIQNNKVEPGERKNLIDGASTIFHGGFQYISGTYSKRSSLYSKGLYLSKFVNGRQQFIKYHDYADLNNFFGYMNERRENRIKEKIRKKKEKGKNPNFSYRLMAHDMIRRGDTYILIAEAYYPRYSNYSSSMPYSWASPYSYSRYNPSFMGYRYTHAIVVAFDRNGNILWDNSFEINDVLTYSLEKFVSVNIYEDKIILMYLQENEIRTKVINGNDIVEGKTFNSVRLANESDELKNKDPDIEGLKKWYGNTLYAFGEQDIYNERSEDGKETREIFYINKIEYNLSENPN